MRFIPMIVLMGMIFYLSHQPGDFVRLPQFTGIDKLVHLAAYGGLAASILYGLHPFKHLHNAAPALIAVLICLLYGISDEFHQAFIAGRHAGFWDVVADVSGALLVAGWWYRRKGSGMR